MTEVPTLGEMRHTLDDPVPPTLGEMVHANLLYRTDPDAYLEHYGVKGMKWGIRRSRDLLARAAGRAKTAAVGTKDEEGNVVGGIRAKSRAGAERLKNMRAGETLILEDANGASKIMSKQKDGTFKEVYLSADAERVLRTTQKDSSEMSDKEINDAINRSKKIEEYNRIFGQQPNPNADLQAKVDAMELQIKLRNAERLLNPPKRSLVSRFVGASEAGFKGYKKADKALDGDLSKMMKELIGDLSSAKNTNATSTAGRAAAAAAAAAKANRNRKREEKEAEDRFWSGGDDLKTGATNVSDRVRPTTVTAEQQRRVDDFIRDMSSRDPLSPYNITSLPPGPSYPELESRR